MTKEFNTARKSNLYRGGTFWYEHLSSDQRLLVQTLFHTIDQSGSWSGLNTIPKRVVPSTVIDVRHYTIDFEYDSVVSILLDQNTRLQDSTDNEYSALPVPKVFAADNVTGLILEGETPKIWEEYGAVVLIPARVDSTKWNELGYTGYSYLVQHSHNTIPHILRNKNGYLFAGVDFYNTKQGMVFNKDPGVVFPDGRIHVLHGVELSKTIFAYSACVDPSVSAGVMINRYLRSTHSPRDLVAALNELLGLDAFTETGEVLDVLPCEDGSTLYVFTDSIVRIRQPHTIVPIGDMVMAAQVPGAVVTARCKAMNGESWFDGYELPVNGLPASSVLQYAAPTDRIPAGSLAVVNNGGAAVFDLGTSYLSSELFNINRARTDALGAQSFSNWVLGHLDAENKFDLLDFLFRNVWRDNGLIITYSLDRTTEDEVRRIRDFLYRNQPLNAVVFLLPDK